MDPRPYVPGRPREQDTGGAVRRSSSPYGPSPTRTSRASRARGRSQARSRTSWPFCRLSRPTHTTRGASAGTPSSRARPARAEAAPPPGRKRPRSMPLWITDQRAAIPARSPARRSDSLTQRMRSLQRAPKRSHAMAIPAARPSRASNDQACGWNTVGTRPRTASRPTSPALALWAWITSGAQARTSRAAVVTSRPSRGPGTRSAGQAHTRAPASAASAASGPSGGQATTGRSPARTCAATRSVTTRATPPSTGWTR